MKNHILQNIIDILRKKKKLKFYLTLNPLYNIYKKKNAINVIGDSHCNFFSGNEQLAYFNCPLEYGINNCQDKFNTFNTFHVGPALAYNLNKYNTKTKAREKIEYLLKHNIIRKKSKIICCFGEIDIRVHVLKEALRQHMDYKLVIDNIIENYLNFLLSLKKRNKIYVWGPIPTQKDNSLINPEYPYFGDEITRNKATSYFNNKLEEVCIKNKIVFLSIFKNLINDNFTTKDEFIADGCHLSQKAWVFAQKELESKGLL